MDEKQQDKERDEMLKQSFAKTRKSSIARLDNWEDQRTWDEFYQTYWRLIYSVANGEIKILSKTSISSNSIIKLISSSLVESIST